MAGNLTFFAEQQERWRANPAVIVQGAGDDWIAYDAPAQDRRVIAISGNGGDSISNVTARLSGKWDEDVTELLIAALATVDPRFEAPAREAVRAFPNG